MKKYIVLLLSLIFTLTSVKAAVDFGTALSQSETKPALVLLYAGWADGYKTAITQFRAAQLELGDDFNYVEIDIAKPEAKSFNAKYSIRPNLPHILMMRSNGRVMYYLNKSCTSSSECIISKAKSFLR